MADERTEGTLNWLASGVAAGAAVGGIEGSAAKGPGFEYSLEQLRTLQGKWEDAANGFKEDQRYAEPIADARGPGGEYASRDNANMVQSSGQTLMATLKEREGYCRAQAEAFNAAMGAYATNEDDSADDIKRQGGTL